jgi:hypothetical protein
MDKTVHVWIEHQLSQLSSLLVSNILYIFSFVHCRRDEPGALVCPGQGQWGVRLRGRDKGQDSPRVDRSSAVSPVVFASLTFAVQLFFC